MQSVADAAEKHSPSGQAEAYVPHCLNGVLYQRVKWCPGAELNHRHEDFQSTALPLSYPGTGSEGRFAVRGSGRFRIGCMGWQEDSLMLVNFWFNFVGI